MLTRLQIVWFTSTNVAFKLQTSTVLLINGVRYKTGYYSLWINFHVCGWVVSGDFSFLSFWVVGCICFSICDDETDCWVRLLLASWVLHISTQKMITIESNARYTWRKVRKVQRKFSRFHQKINCNMKGPTSYELLQSFFFCQCATLTFIYSHVSSCFSNQTCGRHELDDVEHVWSWASHMD